MRTARRLSRWFGLGTQQPVVGITIGNDELVMVALRPDPLGLVGIARRKSVDGAVVDGSVRLPQRVIGVLDEMRRALNLPNDSDCAVSIEPIADKLQAQFATEVTGPADYTGQFDLREPEVEVSRSRFDRATYVTTAAGFRPRRVDVTPASLARLALVEYPGSAMLRSADGWSVFVDDDLLDAAKRSKTSVQSMRLGPDMGQCETTTGLAGIVIPADLASVVELDADATAIGAALGLLGLPPLVTAVPSSPTPGNVTLTIEAITKSTTEESDNEYDREYARANRRNENREHEAASAGASSHHI